MTGPTDAGGLRSLVWNSKLQLWLHICLVNSSWNSWFPGESLCQSRQWSMLAPSAWMQGRVRRETLTAVAPLSQYNG